MAACYGRRPAGMKKMTSAAYFGQAEAILYIFTIFTGAERNREKGYPSNSPFRSRPINSRMASWGSPFSYRTWYTD